MDSRTQRLVALSMATLAIGCARARTEDVGLADTTTATTTVTSDSMVASRTTTTTDTVMRDTTAMRDTMATRDTSMTRDTTAGDTTRVSATGDVSLGVGTATDAQVAQLIATVDRAEIEEARLVLSKTQNSELRTYAQRLVDDHSASLAKVDSANATTSSMTSRDSTSATTRSSTTVTTDSTRRDSTHTMHQTTTQSSTTGSPDVGSAIASLQADHARKMDMLRGQSGTSFDRAYIQGQVEGHQKVLSLLRRFGSNVNMGSLRSHVSGYSDKVSHHLEQARTLQRSISSE